VLPDRVEILAIVTKSEAEVWLRWFENLRRLGGAPGRFEFAEAKKRFW
jgi:hypothetical protein